MRLRHSENGWHQSILEVLIENLQHNYPLQPPRHCVLHIQHLRNSSYAKEHFRIPQEISNQRKKLQQNVDTSKRILVQ
jgi:hypothetical protein